MVSDVVRCLEWTAAIERSSRTLPGPRRREHPECRDYVHDHRLAAVATLDGSSAFPLRGMFVDLGTGQVRIDAGRRGEVRSTAAADVVLAGGNRTAEQLRFRSFYLTGPRADAARTLAVQQRRIPRLATQLVQGARAQARVAGKVPFAVPRILETGRARRGLPPGVVADWAVEEVLDGAQIGGPDVVDTVREMITLLEQMWHRLGFLHTPIERAARDRASATLAHLVIRQPDGIWPAELDPERIGAQVKRLFTDTRPLTVGLTHGDAGVGNALRLADGRLALIDWEHAARRPVAFDVVKALMSAPDPARLAADQDTPPSLRPALTAAGAAPWRDQLAIAATIFLTGWRNRHHWAVQSGGERASQQRLHKALRMLDRLLDD